MVETSMLELSGLIGICPDVYTRFPTSIACEYGPIAAGALLVNIFFIVFLLIETRPSVIDSLVFLI